MTGLLPYVGTEGKFNFSDKLLKFIDANKIYKVISLRTMSSLLDSGILVRKIVYDRYDLGSDEYYNDVENNTVIVELQDELGRKYYVPSTHITSIPDITGVRYVGKIITVDLGFIPKNMDLNSLAKFIKDSTIAFIGVEPTVKTIVSTPETIVPYDMDKSNAVNRKYLKNSKDNILVEYLKCKELNKKLLAQNKTLLEVLKSKEWSLLA